MQEIIIWLSLTAFFFLSFLATLLLGLIRKKQKIVIISFGILILMLGCLSGAISSVVSKSYHKVASVFKSRTGIEIYAALFGEPEHRCVKIIRCQDQVIPKIDDAIWLYFETCPLELKRILNLQDYSCKKEPAEDVTTEGPRDDKNWFNPKTLGDSIFVFNHVKDSFGNYQTIYSSLDSTRVFCVDVED